MPKPTDWTRRLWENLQDITQNEQAWEVIEAAAKELRKGRMATNDLAELIKVNAIRERAELMNERLLNSNRPHGVDALLEGRQPVGSNLASRRVNRPPEEFRKGSAAPVPESETAPDMGGAHPISFSSDFAGMVPPTTEGVSVTDRPYDSTEVGGRGRGSGARATGESPCPPSQLASPVGSAPAGGFGPAPF